MNIFILDSDPVLAANLVDKHIVKMPLESAQILCTVAQEKGFTAPYKPTHKHHPCIKWVAQSSANWNWLCEHGLAICNNYTISYNKVHKCQAIIQDMQDLTTEIWGASLSLDNHDPFVLCMPDQYKVEDPVESYRNYYRAEKAYIAKWTNRIIPSWWTK